VVGLAVLVVESRTRVEGVTGGDVIEFLLDCTDERYQAWWPGVHRELHALHRSGRPDHVGDVVLMDEMVGPRHLRLTAVVREVQPGRRLVLQVHKGVPLPVWLVIETTDDEGGVDVRHSIRAGWSGPAKVLDPLFRLHLSPPFAAAMHEHVRTEFARLGRLLRS